MPLRIWIYDPSDNRMIGDWGIGTYSGHVNDWARQGDKVYGAISSSGSLIELDPKHPPDGKSLDKATNPVRLYGDEPEGINLFGRAHVVFAHPDDTHVLVGGNPRRALAGGGMLIHSVQTGESQLLGPDVLVPDQGIGKGLAEVGEI